MLCIYVSMYSNLKISYMHIYICIAFVLYLVDQLFFYHIRIYIYIYIYIVYITHTNFHPLFFFGLVCFLLQKRKIYLNFTNCIFGTASCITFTVTMCTNTSKFTISNNLVFITNWGTSHMIFQNFTNTRCITCLCR